MTGFFFLKVIVSLRLTHGKPLRLQGKCRFRLLPAFGQYTYLSLFDDSLFIVLIKLNSRSSASAAVHT